MITFYSHYNLIFLTFYSYYVYNTNNSEAIKVKRRFKDLFKQLLI